MSSPHTTFDLTVTDGVARIVFDNPPVNVISAALMQELGVCLRELRDDVAVKVIVFASANPHFFLAHVDMHLAEDLDVLNELAAMAPSGVNVFQAVGELLRTQPQVTIVELAGKARGGGAEFVAAADMTFAATETAALGQIESLMGIVPSGGGTQYLLERVGRHRALEIVLTGDLYDATTAASYGWINRAVPAADLTAVVDTIARNIAALPEGVIHGVKHVLAPTRPQQGYEREETAWSALIGAPAARTLMSQALELGAQTVEGETDLERIMRSIAV